VRTLLSRVSRTVICCVQKKCSVHRSTPLYIYLFSHTRGFTYSLSVNSARVICKKLWPRIIMTRGEVPVPSASPSVPNTMIPANSHNLAIPISIPAAQFNNFENAVNNKKITAHFHPPILSACSPRHSRTLAQRIRLLRHLTIRIQEIIFPLFTIFSCKH